MSDEKPKKRGRPKKVDSEKAVPSLSAQQMKISVNSPDELLKVQALIRDALKDVIKEDDIRLKDKNLMINAMVGTCSEFMRNFIIMGYDLDNNAIEPIFYAKSDLEADALAHYMQSYFVESMKHQR